MKDYTDIIVTWYQENKRNLPWRQDQNPYHVWISEIMLQQTRIEAVIDYYNRFLQEVPTIKDLANVSDEKLLKLWEGLGYYNRARNLKKAAIIITKLGYFPYTYEELIKLPGIGEYTASAISSICYNEREVTIDGNVLRVYARFYNDKRNILEEKVKKDIHNNLLKIIPKSSGDFNQGLMEIGETICLPNGTPKCESCPLYKDCKARLNNTYQSIPVREKNTTKKNEYYTVLLLKYKDKVVIKKREQETLLNNLYTFPDLEGTLSENDLIVYLQNMSIPYQSIKQGPDNIHIFTHKKWNMISYIITLNKRISDYNFVSLNEIISNYAIPTAHKKFLNYLLKD